MKFIDQLKQEVQIHGDMETDFRSRRYQHAHAIALRYIDEIEESARMAARNGEYERLEGRHVIRGFCTLNEKDFEQPYIRTEMRRTKLTRKRRLDCALVADNEFFEAFLSAFRQLCIEEDIVYFPFQAQILGKDGRILYHTLPFTLRHPKKEKIQAFGFPYQIEF